MLLNATSSSFFILLAYCLREAALELHKSSLGILRGRNDGAVPKATLTQKGYIQFLKYVVEVPEIKDYTFCIWVKSYNLTHSHPLLSYSRHEDERLIRAWISPHGTHINLELLQIVVFRVPLNAVEHRWYHICQSWSAQQAAWAVFVNGQLKGSGYQPQLQNLQIPPHGDLVVGQEYTDFDKGLDDGIEGDISGFNIVLESIFPRYIQNDLIEYNGLDRRKNFDSLLPARHQMPKSLGLVLVELGRNCSYLRGAPLSGTGVLVSWTKTEVRVFGGATLKSVSTFCGN